MIIHPGFIGIDVSKAHLDIFDSASGTTRRIANTPQAIAGFITSLAGHTVSILFEATGRHDAKLRHALGEAGRPFSRVNPARARDFARAAGLLAKTDALDARMLAAMAQALALPAEPARERPRQHLAALQARRDQLVAMRKMEKTRLAEGEEVWRTGIELHIQWLDAAIQMAEAEIRSRLRRNAELARLEKLLRSIPGIGPVAAATLIALMPELGQCSPKAAAALAGLAPFNHDSGTLRGRRAIQGGRKRVRDALYMAAVAASRSHSRFANTFNALIDRKKPFKVAIIALARKILATANAIARDQRPYAH